MDLSSANFIFATAKKVGKQYTFTFTGVMLMSTVTNIVYAFVKQEIRPKMFKHLRKLKSLIRLLLVYFHGVHYG